MPKKTRLAAGSSLFLALAGNANVGKSVLFNQLVGFRQVVGNWPGKTVERAEGFLSFRGHGVTVVDLPGIYSLSTYTQEELITRNYIISEKPDVVVNVVDASVLERNLFFSIQLIEMEVPMVICLNQVDTARRKGISVDHKKLTEILGIPVVPTVAVRGVGIEELTSSALNIAEQKKKPSLKMTYSEEIEKRIVELAKTIELKDLKLNVSARWLAIKLLEDDEEIKVIIGAKSNEVVEMADELAEEIATFYKEPCFAVVAMERYTLASQIAATVQQQIKQELSLAERLDAITTHRMFGYITAVSTITGLLLWTFTAGGILSSLLSNVLSVIESLNLKVSEPITSVLWNGAFGGFVAGATLVIPFVLPFYFLLAVIEDSGYLTRIAFMMDSAMHKLGLHGKAIIPIMLGYGCNVPAIFSCRTMETRREQLLGAFVITLVPCSARTVVILGLVAAFIGIQWALALYFIDVLVIFALGRLAFKTMPGKTSGMIMEMHSFRMPSLSVVAKQTWIRTKSLVYLVFPTYIIGSALIQVMFTLGVLEPVNNALSTVTVGWLGLPTVTGILLIFGFVRKEMTILMLATLFGTLNFASILAPVQLFVLALIAMLYIPCLATILTLAKEFNPKSALVITVAEVAFAILLGGIAYRLLSLVT